MRPRYFSYAVSLVFALVPPGAVAKGQACPGGTVSAIEIHNRSVFEAGDVPARSPLGWAYRLADALHVRTRADFLQKELLFRVGDCWNPSLFEESERLLRAYGFIAGAEVKGWPEAGGDRSVVVTTRDEWSTKVDVGVRVEGGLRLEGISLSEENLAGRGILVRLFLRQRREAREVGLELHSPRLVDSRWDGRLSAGVTRNGHFFEEALVYPFVGEVGRWGGGQTFVRREDLFAYSLPEESLYTHLTIPLHEERLEIFGGVRLGPPGRLTALGGGLVVEELRFPGLPRAASLVKDGEFSQKAPAGEDFLSGISHQLRERRGARLEIYLGQRNLRFLPRQGLDALRGTQDVPTGFEVSLALGWGLGGFRRDGVPPTPNHLYLRGSLLHGWASHRLTWNARHFVQARLRRSVPPFHQGSEDVLAETDAFLYWQPDPAGPQTSVFRVSTAGGWEMRTPFQLTLGGPTAVRGFREDRFPGGRRVVLTAEQRIGLGWPAPDFMDFGISAFLDVGRIWAGGAPFGLDSGWRASLGAGIRFGLPPGTSNMVRADMAFPLARRAQAKDLVFRLTLQEVLGLLPGFLDEQVSRSLGRKAYPYPTGFPG